jgi:hypothetical protein
MEAYHVVDHGNEEVKEQSASTLHFHLHGARTFERVATADDQGEIVCS